MFVFNRTWYQLLDQNAHLLEESLLRRTRKITHWSMDCHHLTLLTQFACLGIDLAFSLALSFLSKLKKAGILVGYAFRLLSKE